MEQYFQYFSELQSGGSVVAYIVDCLLPGVTFVETGLSAEDKTGGAPVQAPYCLITQPTKVKMCTHENIRHLKNVHI